MNLAVTSTLCEEASLTVGVVAVAAGVLTVACSSNGTTAPTTSAAVQTSVQTSVATATETVTATPIYQPRDQFPRNDNRSQFGSQQGH